MQDTVSLIDVTYVTLRYIGCNAKSELRTFTSLRFYAKKQLLLSARLSHRNSVCLFVCHTGGSVKTVQVRITKSSPSDDWKTLVSGTIKLFHKFKGGHPERGR